MREELRPLLRDTIIAVIAKYRDVMPEDLREWRLRAMKASETLTAILGEYHDNITRALIGYFTDGGNTKADFKRAMRGAFQDAFDLGFIDGGGGLEEIPELDLAWLDGRKAEEAGYIDAVYVDARALKRDKEFDYFTWATERADGYAQTVKLIYAEAKTRGAKNKMLTFAGDDGQESCTDCQRYKGQRHRASWWVSHNAIPPNREFECGGYRCQHYLEDDNGARWNE
jgi:hypothetical protein